MQKKYFLKFKDTVIATIDELKNTLKYTVHSHNALEIENGMGYPLGIFPLDISSNDLGPQKDYAPTEVDIRNWLSRRVPPKNRDGIEALLVELELSSYDVWSIAKKTKAISLNDFYWITHNRKEKFDDCHPRGGAYEKEVIIDSDRH
jgi:hypothetical protein